MNGVTERVFHCSGRAGFCMPRNDGAEVHRARKLQREVQVRFAADDGLISTREGTVRVLAGDAIITGIGGEQWRVSRAHFAGKYRPGAATTAGTAGAYFSRPYEVLAVQMDGSFEVLLSDGSSRLHGRQGDWLVDYGDGSLGVVAAGIFASTYELLD